MKFREKGKVKPFEIDFKTNLHIIKSDEDTFVPDGMVPLEIITDYRNKVTIINSSKVLTKDFAYASFLCEMMSSGRIQPE